MDFHQIKSNMEKVIVGKSETIDLVLTALLAGGHILLEDVPGTGKTMLAKALQHHFHWIFRESSLHRIYFRGM